MLAFRDFVPAVTRPRGLLRAAEFESFDKAVLAAGEWMRENGIRPIQIETVVLPEIHDSNEDGTADAQLAAGEQPWWYQFLRIWHER